MVELIQGEVENSKMDSVPSHKYLYLICHSCESRNPEPKPLDSRFHGNDERK